MFHSQANKVILMVQYCAHVHASTFRAMITLSEPTNSYCWSAAQAHAFTRIRVSFSPSFVSLPRCTACVIFLFLSKGGLEDGLNHRHGNFAPCKNTQKAGMRSGRHNLLVTSCYSNIILSNMKHFCQGSRHDTDDDDEVMLNVLGCRLTY